MPVSSLCSSTCVSEYDAATQSIKLTMQNDRQEISHILSREVFHTVSYCFILFHAFSYSFMSFFWPCESSSDVTGEMWRPCGFTHGKPSA